MLECWVLESKNNIYFKLPGMFCILLHISGLILSTVFARISQINCSGCQNNNNYSKATLYWVLKQKMAELSFYHNSKVASVSQKFHNQVDVDIDQGLWTWWAKLYYHWLLFLEVEVYGKDVNTPELCKMFALCLSLGRFGLNINTLYLI